MYKEQIKEILMKTYDVCAYTLDCGSSAVRGNKLYYYTLNKDYEKEIILLRNVLESQLSKNSIGCLNELMQFFPGDKWELPQCACYTETKGSWRLTFHYMKGIRYHRTFGKHVAATLILQDAYLILRDIRLCEEEESLVCYRYNPKDVYAERFLRYKDPDKYYPVGDFQKRTNGLGLMRSFRACLAEYIKEYEPSDLFSDLSLTKRQNQRNSLFLANGVFLPMILY